MVATTRRNGPYAPLGANYADDDGIATLDVQQDDRTELLYLRALAFCARDPRTEGFISNIALQSGRVLRRASTRKGGDSIMASAEKLADLGLWTRVEGGYTVTAWLKWNRSWAEISGEKQADAARKRAQKALTPDPTPDGDGADSGRIPLGVGTPKHGTSRHVTSEHATVATMDGNRLLGEHLDALAQQPPRAQKQRIGQEIDKLIAEGIEPDRIRKGLAVMRAKPHMGPSLLPAAVAEADSTRGTVMTKDADGRVCAPGQENLPTYERFRSVTL